MRLKVLLFGCEALYSSIFCAKMQIYLVGLFLALRIILKEQNKYGPCGEKTNLLRLQSGKAKSILLS